ncbi:hypothetical protein B0H14DRAFT_2958744 [Mycena olivaceomarginata]|nr:hypothetical protein B0H14DRAFT_2958744 [Mycena olivaceomarginata]
MFKRMNSVDQPAILGENRENMVISNLLATLKILEVGTVVQAAPFIEPIGAIISEFITAYKEAKDNHGKRDALLEKAADLGRDVGEAILRLEQGGYAGQISRLRSDLEEYAELLAIARNAIVAYDNHGRLGRVLKREEIGSKLDSVGSRLDHFGARFRTNRLVAIEIKEDKVAENVDMIKRAMLKDPRILSFLVIATLKSVGIQVDNPVLAENPLQTRGESFAVYST